MLMDRDFLTPSTIKRTVSARNLSSEMTGRDVGSHLRLCRILTSQNGSFGYSRRVHVSRKKDSKCCEGGSEGPHDGDDGNDDVLDILSGKEVPLIAHPSVKGPELRQEATRSWR